jgi:hypothetical protein
MRRVAAGNGTGAAVDSSLHRGEPMRRRAFLALIASLPLGVACRRSSRGTTSDATPSESSGSADPYGYGSGAQPAPTSYQMIEPWAMHQVPLYPGAQPGDLSPLATQVENGGTISFAVPDPADRVLEFYRTALPQLGWQLQSAPKNSLAAKRGEAALTVVVKASDQGTTVLLMLTDAI